MYDYSKLIDAYNEYYIDRLNSNKDKLIESFVIYYGEKYRNIIVERFNKIIFCWYLSNFTKNIYKGYICETITKKRVEHTKKILNILGYNELKINNIENGSLLYKNDIQLIFPGTISSIYCGNKKIDKVLKFMFGKNNIFNYDYDSKLYNFFSLKEKDKIRFVKKVFKTNKINDEISNKIKEAIDYMDIIKKEKNDDLKYIDFALFSQYLNHNNKSEILGASKDVLFSSEWKFVLELLNNIVDYVPRQKTLSSDCKIIMLPMLYTEDSELIHEVNHAITSSVFANIEGMVIPFTKTGLNNTFDEETALEELLNEISTIEITKIFNDLGGNIFNDKNCYIPLVSLYKKVLPLVNPFYFKYKDIINEARITENSNILYKYIDKDKYLEFKTFVSKVSKEVENRLNNTENTIYDTDNFIKYEEYKMSFQLIEAMDKKQSEEMGIEEYAKLLRNEGKIVNIINHEDNVVNHKKL